MRTELDVPLAAAEATEVFRRFPVRVCMPLVTVGLLSTCEIPFFRWQEQHAGGWTAFWGTALSLLGYWIYCAAEAGAAAMYLKIRAGDKPTFRDVGRIVSKPRFNAVARELLVRYIGWGLVWVLAGLLIFGVVQATRAVAHVPIATLVHPNLARIAAELFLPFVIYRYTFVFPQFAIADGVGPGFVDRCVQQANRVRKVALLFPPSSGAGRCCSPRRSGCCCTILAPPLPQR